MVRILNGLFKKRVGVFSTEKSNKSICEICVMIAMTVDNETLEMLKDTCAELIVVNLSFIKRVLN